jgi:hypothetical protein
MTQVAPASTPDDGATVQLVPSDALSGSVAVPAIAIAAPSCPEYGPPAPAVGAVVNRTEVQPGKEIPTADVTLAAQLW